MLSCERVSIPLTGAQRPPTTTAITPPVGMPNAPFTSHLSVAPACFARAEVASNSNLNSSSNTNRNNNSDGNKSCDNNNTTTMNGGTRVPSPAAMAASYFSAMWPQNGGAGGQGYNTVPLSTNLAVTTATATVTATVKGPVTMAAVEDTGDENGEVDNEGEEQTASSNDLPTPETGTNTTPTTTVEEGFGHTHEEGPQQEQQQLSPGGQQQELQRRQKCGLSHGTAPLPSHHRGDTSGVEAAMNDVKGVTAAGGAAETEKHVSCAYHLKVVAPPHELLKSRVDVATAREAVTLFLEQLCEENKAEPVLTSDFHSHRLPQMSVESYVDRIVRYSRVGGETLIVSLMLLLKYSHFINHPVSIYNVHRLMITSALLGAKLRDDVYYSNEYYSRIGGISNVEINKLELRFCTWLEWDMWVEEAEYATLEALLLRLVAHVTVNAEDADGATRRSAQRDFWVAHLRPWKERFEAASVQRLDRIRRNEAEDLSNERAKSRGMSTHGALFPRNPPGYHGRGMVGGPLDQVILPTVCRRGPGETQSHTHDTAAVTVAAQSGAGTAWMPLQLSKWQGGGVYDGNANTNNTSATVGDGCSSSSGAGFGILERAMSTSATSAAAPSSCISIHAKPYHYGGRTGSNRNFSTSRHQQHLYHHASSQRVGTGQGEEHDTATKQGSSSTTRSSGCHTVHTSKSNYPSHSRSNSSKHNNAQLNGNGTGFASIIATNWRASGQDTSNANGSGGVGPVDFPAQPRLGVENPEESVTAQCVGRKRPKPEHYKDYC
ncbi:CYC2-like cyclin 4 [Trypanosoma rangeli]|uniref:CYC2-like cyclin 4 n=1 Tax=Trypanosoma rangeli TaxID=5698 RepID=A0A422NJD8_TRYRA|nr:CYC2-like cyclin 4 [Trypanosoma rangeli]RNF05567.1 CYC2-like cyclin 4 [Trypanosoma rangeli]|eukprot:RNF05567.1 CYC2-like cyclin 4 [Trypanosoma rangeli]